VLDFEKANGGRRGQGKIVRKRQQNPLDIRDWPQRLSAAWHISMLREAGSEHQYENDTYHRRILGYQVFSQCEFICGSLARMTAGTR
jgi:hypothetical protein